MNTFIKRSITGILFVALILASILFFPYCFAVLFFIITVLTLHEFYTLVKPDANKGHLYIDLLGGGTLFFSTFVIASEMTELSILQILSPYFLYLIYSAISQLYMKLENPITDWALSIMGQIYVALPFSLLNFMVYQQGDEGVFYYPYILLALFAFIWLNDTGAFLVGSVLGRRKLFERISPKKSWEGFFGGLFVSIGSSFAFAYFLPELSLWQWIGMALVVSLFSTWGDLCESLIKRTIHVKDSGQLLPGHGGMLDRFDSLLLAAPALLIYLILIQ